MSADCECSRHRICPTCLERSIIRKMAACAPVQPAPDRFVRDLEPGFVQVQPRRPAR